ncbi:MAG: hypothetical protein DRI93_05620 [Aquificota bacterium]|nr:MAG: hypothetical protein DRI93_05620 [Aquificota bacterium]
MSAIYTMSSNPFSSLEKFPCLNRSFKAFRRFVLGRFNEAKEKSPVNRQGRKGQARLREFRRKGGRP